jgi:hypothetical protein
MSAEGIKPLASLGAGLLGRRAPARRVPLTFAPIEDLAGDADVEADLPEVVLQVARLAHALGISAPAELVDGDAQASAAPRQRIAFTLRLDPVRHGRLRQIAADQRRSAQQVLVEAFDHYSDGASGPAAIPATLPSPSEAPTGNQP